MPFFRYSARDSSGGAVDGTVEANSPEDAMQDLLRKGYTVQQIMKSVPPPISRPAGVVSRPPAGRAQRASTATAASGPAKLRIQQVHTRRASDHDRMFLFSQLAQQLKAGIGPAESLSDLSKRVAWQMRDALEDISKIAGQGGTLSEGFEKYPDLFPEYVAGTIRAAEAGGFLPEACGLLADQARNSYAFSRWFWFVRPVLVNGLLTLPLAWLAVRTILRGYALVESQGESSSMGTAVSAMLQEAGRQLVWPVGPITLACWALVYGSYRWFASPPMRQARHEVALRWPVFGPRTRHECLSVFTWVMARVVNAGVSPNRAWGLAVQSVPNFAVRERLERIGRSLTSSEKLSDAVFKEDFFPREYAPMIATAEFTGDYTAAFEQLAKVSQVEFEAAQTNARMKSARWGFLFYLIIGGIVMIMLAYMFYRQLLPLVAGGLDFLWRSIQMSHAQL